MLVIRQEEVKDHSTVFQIIETAFKTMIYSSHTEQFIVEKLRQSDAFIPELSLVAELDGRLVGHIILSKIQIKNNATSFPSLALGPVSVLPDFQRQGFGAKLIKAAHAIARKLGHTSVILVGHADYYPRFGYRKTSEFGIQLPFESPEENCMALELVENGLKNVNGMVFYPRAFFE